MKTTLVGCVWALYGLCFALVAGSSCDDSSHQPGRAGAGGAKGGASDGAELGGTAGTADVSVSVRRVA